MLTSVDEAHELLRQLDAPKRLIRHAELVNETGEAIIALLQTQQIEFDANFVRIGCILHDAGKILHPDELEIEGNQHTTAGQQLLLQNGVRPEIAAICVSHDDWQAQDCSLEELLVVLGDKLWKGSRKQDLETIVIQRISEKTKRDFWEIFIELDSGFETIASNGLSKITSSI